MEVTFLNVGYGEAIVITDGGHCIVMDGGSADPAIYSDPATISITAYLQQQGIPKIDLLVMTHLHDDHIGGLVTLIETIPVETIWCNVLPKGGFTGRLESFSEQLQQDRSCRLFYTALKCYDRIRTLAEQKRIPIMAIHGDSGETKIGSMQIIPLGMNAFQMKYEQEMFDRLFQMKDEIAFLQLFRKLDGHCNATSLALCVRCGKGAALLSGDKVEGWTAEKRTHDLKANVLKLTHHGQKDGMPHAMVSAADPDAFVICADSAHTYGSASAEVLDAAKRYLDEKGKTERIYVTGELSDHQGAACAVRFSITEQGTLSCVTLLHK